MPPLIHFFCPFTTYSPPSFFATAFKAATIYLAIALLWLLFTEQLLNAIVDAAVKLSLAQIFTPWLAAARSQLANTARSQMSESFTDTVRSLEKQQTSIHDQAEVTAETRRRRLIEKTLLRVIGEMEKKSTKSVFQCWSLWARLRKRIQNISVRAEGVTASAAVSKAFLPHGKT